MSWAFIEWNNNHHLKQTHIILPHHSFSYLLSFFTLSPLLPFPSLPFSSLLFSSLIISSLLFFSLLFTSLLFFHFSSHLISTPILSLLSTSLSYSPISLPLGHTVCSVACVEHHHWLRSSHSTYVLHFEQHLYDPSLLQIEEIYKRVRTLHYESEDQ